MDKLLDFVDNLDYETYIQDVEMNSMLASLKERIDQINEEKKLIEQLKKEQ